MNKWEKKCWGRVKHIEHPYTLISILEVEKGFRCSRHLHVHRFNSFRVISGSLLIEIFDNDGNPTLDIHPILIKTGEDVTIEPGINHRFEVRESGVVVETYWTTDGTIPSIDDIVRLDEGGPV